MLGRTYEGQNCSAARTLELVGERWSLLILRDAMFRGFTRFSEFQRSLGIAPNILTARLDRFVEAGLMHRCADGSPDSRSYALTAKGRDLQPVLIALSAWGDRWAAPDGPPITYVHEDCGGQVSLQAQCANCGPVPDSASVMARNPRDFAGAARDLRNKQAITGQGRSPGETAGHPKAAPIDTGTRIKLLVKTHSGNPLSDGEGQRPLRVAN